MAIPGFTDEAVASVVRNRVLAGIYAGRDDWRKVMPAPLQFPCFNSNDPNRAKLLTPVDWEPEPGWEACYGVASSILNGTLADNTGRATHYHATGTPVPSRGTYFTHTVDIGRHSFFRDPAAYRFRCARHAAGSTTSSASTRSIP